MERGNPVATPAARDRAVRRVRRAGRVLAVAAAGATAVFSVVAANAFRGHNGKARARVGVAPAAVRHARVPPPEQVPSIDGAPPPLQSPAQPPAAAPAPAESAPPPETSGGS